MSDVREVLVPVERWARWRENFATRHGETTATVSGDALRGEAADGSVFEARGPLDQVWDDAALAPEGTWGVLLVRKGGFAVARLHGPEVAESKVGQRHVQGRTKAGGQSQQRFARRRANQARAAYDAAADHAARLLAGDESVERVVTGGDRDAVAAVLEDPRLRGLRVVDPWLPVPDPRRSVLEQAVRDATSVRVRVTNA
ncbi:acVLRF1 family peptidyl-tRNA hydrolase [Nocardioides aequoreus]|uniref:acVLRF1 family peptidyl-tRNA hydrolase n=1 Tax=Nocardioides aequoreus TaxID=397278 RepID=UPI000AE34A81|nr:acVLRF1 family peptidyl-tRNA hydrolase [Nocardioides aequoreus]